MKLLVETLKREKFLLFIVLLGLLARLYWISYTNFTEEDAFITFRIAKNLANGFGLAYNVGEHVLGSTSPLFALLLGGWIAFLSNNVILGARIINLTTSIFSLIFLAITLRKIGATTLQQISVLVIFAISSKLILLEMGGMETSLAIFFMMFSWYLFVSRRIVLTGIVLGLILLTRPDLFVWPISILLVELISHSKQALRISIIVFLIGLPWIIFSLVYFGSPIPHTINAKWVAYIQNDTTPFSTHFLTLANYLSPFSQYKDYIFLRNILAWFTLIVATWETINEIRYKKLSLIAVFVILDFLRLIFTRATFFDRYFSLVLVAILILFGMGIGNLLDRVNGMSILAKSLYYLLLIVLVGTGLIFAGFEANQKKMMQEFRYESSLKRIGIWLNKNTLPSETVLLEPLGYIGFYSDRYMIDEVGLISPRIVSLKRMGIEAHNYLPILQPDYYVLHCDDAFGLQHLNGDSDGGFSEEYTLRTTFNPLNYDMQQPDYSRFGALQRNSCYDIWQRIKRK